MKKEDIYLLSQLINTLEEAGEKLQLAFSQNDSAKLTKIKRFILQIQGKIDEVLA